MWELSLLFPIGFHHLKDDASFFFFHENLHIPSFCSTRFEHVDNLYMSTGYIFIHVHGAHVHSFWSLSWSLSTSARRQDVGIKDTLGGLLLAGTDLANQLAKKVANCWETAGKLLGNCWENGDLISFQAISRRWDEMRFPTCPFAPQFWVTPSAILKTLILKLMFCGAMRDIAKRGFGNSSIIDSVYCEAAHIIYIQFLRILHFCRPRLDVWSNWRMECCGCDIIDNSGG